MDVRDLFKSLVWDTLIKEAIARLFVFLPGLGWGPIGAIVSFVIKHFTDKLYEVLVLAVKLEAVVMRNNEMHQAFTVASIELHTIARNLGIDSPEFRRARDVHKEKLAAFVRTNV